MTYEVKLWGGFVNDRLDWQYTTDEYGTFKECAVFRNRREAKERYTDVRRINISEAKDKSHE